MLSQDAEMLADIPAPGNQPTLVLPCTHCSHSSMTVHLETLTFLEAQMSGTWSSTVHLWLPSKVLMERSMHSLRAHPMEVKGYDLPSIGRLLCSVQCCILLASKAAHDECWLHMQVAEHQMRMKDGRTGHEEMTISRHIGNKVSSYDTSIDIATRHSFYDSDAYTSKVVQERRVLQVCLCLYYVISTHNVQISTWSAGKNCYKAAAS